MRPLHQLAHHRGYSEGEIQNPGVKDTPFSIQAISNTLVEYAESKIPWSIQPEHRYRDNGLPSLEQFPSTMPMWKSAASLNTLESTINELKRQNIIVCEANSVPVAPTSTPTIVIMPENVPPADRQKASDSSEKQAE